MRFYFLSSWKPKKVIECIKSSCLFMRLLFVIWSRWDTVSDSCSTDWSTALFLFLSRGPTRATYAISYVYILWDMESDGMGLLAIHCWSHGSCFFLCLGGNEKHAAFGPGDATTRKVIKDPKTKKKIAKLEADEAGWI